MPISCAHTRFIQEYFKPVSLCFNLSHELESYDGNPGYYGISFDEILGRQAVELFPCLLGLDTHKDVILPYVSLANGCTVDLHLKASDTGYTVFLIDARRQMQGQQEVQQLANEVGLLNRRLEILRDELTEKNHALEQANQTKTRFIAGMSHELRTPIVSILGHTAWLEKNKSQQPSSNRSLGSIRRSATYLLVLIDNLLQQGKIESDDLHLQRESVDAAKFFTNIVDIMLPLAEVRGLLIQSVIDLPDEHRILIDEHYFRQALLNLLGNAIKFTDTGSVFLMVNIKKNTLIVKVVDTGIGISEDGIHEIFTAFKRGHNVQGRSGLGIGLSIARDIICAMDGEIDVQSRLGKGTEVSIWIPQPVSAPRQVPVEDSERRTLAVRNRVLLVEDCQDLASLYALFFREAGFEFRVIQEPDDFAEVARRWQPDLVLVDYHLGESDGLVLVKAARERGYNGYMIMLTASTGIDEGLHRRALATGCNEFLNKTSDVNQLVAHVQALLSNDD